MTVYTVRAPGKLNLCLYLGPTRDDGLHELASLFESVSLADTLTAQPTAGLHDRTICDAIDGENLVSLALRTAREAGLLSGPPLEVTIEKRVPIAAGMGGGSADAAAALRIAAEIEQRPISDFEAVAFQLGADVPSQLIPGAALVRGAGERVMQLEPERLAGARKRAYVILEQREGLSTGAVFKQADLARLPEQTIVLREESLLEKIANGLDIAGLAALIENAFEPAIVALRPELAGLPAELRTRGALAAAFTGSGPTSFGLFADVEAAETAARELTASGHIARVAVPVGPDYSTPTQVVAR